MNSSQSETEREATAPARARDPRRTDRFRRGLGWTVLIALACAGADALFIEPYWIQTTHYELQAAIPKPLKIALVADIHTHGIGRRERKMFRILASEKPDLIAIAGDSLGDSEIGRPGTYAQVKSVYLRLHAPLGVWFVRGNWENMAPLRHEKQFYQSAGVHLLLNSNAEIEAPAAGRPGVWLIGFDDPSSGTPKPGPAFEGIPPGAYTIAMFHAPAFFDRIAGRVNLVLAGHTHGGQVLFPPIFPPFRPFWLPKGCGRYLSGWYEEKGSRMYVTRGVGMSVLPIRFFCRPEITFIMLGSHGAS